ncbi:MAG: M20/M25/M40 family metallo-hydrolase [Bacteroidetes bacterium]|nr:M20/M25/M40 family metallo-hydrolase [Bacteroidota bacterium]
MKKLFASLICFSLIYANAQSVSKKAIVRHITYLASDSLHGRGAGSDDEAKAADYIARIFADYKLQSLPGKNGYFQNFSFKVKSNPHGDDTNGVVRTCKNVVGYLDNHATHTIVLGAHYDHLGMGYDRNSLDPNPEGKIHNGADDNASGTAGVLELVKVLSAQKKKLNCNVIFCLFSGEELGLVGSKKFVESNHLDSSNIRYMINLDMIGRMNDSTKTLLVMGYGTAAEWGQIIPASNKGFNLKFDSAGIGPSDYASFYLENIPVLGIFTGQHSDYHKPTDDIDKINFKKEKMILEFVARVILEAQTYPRISFLKTVNKESTRTKLKVSLGIMPDYVYDGKGLRIDGVSENKPAIKAGLKKGDVIIKIGEIEILGMQDYMKALSGVNKGDTKKITFLRGQDSMEVEVVF